MPRRTSRTRRSRGELTIRLLIAVGIALLGYVVVTGALAGVLRNRAPDRAHALAPYDGRVTAAWSEALLGKGERAGRVAAANAARQALRQDPTAIPALATLGFTAQLGGDAATARRLFAYSQKLSRRHLKTRLWAIEDAVIRGNVAEALYHYDIALRTSRTAPDILFPILTRAIGDATIRAELVRKLRAGAPWGGAFVYHLTTQGRDWKATAQLFGALDRARVPIYGGAQAAVVNALLGYGLADDAWTYYASVRRGVDRRRSRDPRFAGDPEIASQLDWVPVNDGGVSSSLQRGAGGGVFEFAAPPSVGGPLLRQVQLLPPGVYALHGRSRGIEQSADARPYWALSCSDGRELGRVALPDSAQANGAFGGRFSVPPGCPVQTLTLVARPSTQIAGLSGQIEQVRLEPLQ